MLGSTLGSSTRRKQRRISYILREEEGRYSHSHLPPPPPVQSPSHVESATRVFQIHTPMHRRASKRCLNSHDPAGTVLGSTLYAYRRRVTFYTLLDGLKPLHPSTALYFDILRLPVAPTKFRASIKIRVSLPVVGRAGVLPWH